MGENDIQHEAMRVYHALVDLREDWGGGLVLLCGPGCVNASVPAAVSIAGGTTLAIDSDAAAMKSAMRAGYLDFIVNSLDEALRALKNEVRKRRPLSVGLVADVDATLAEMVERGVQPDLQIVSAGCVGLVDAHGNPICRAFSPQIFLAEEPGASHQAGMDRAFGPQTGLAGLQQIGSQTEPDHLEQTGSHHLLFRGGCRDHFFPAADVAELAAVDSSLLALIGSDDLVRRRWIQRVPQYLREARNGGRWIWLSDEEREQACQLLAGSEVSGGEG